MSEGEGRAKPGEGAREDLPRGLNTRRVKNLDPPKIWEGEVGTFFRPKLEIVDETAKRHFTLPAVICGRFFERQQMTEWEGRAKPGEGAREDPPRGFKHSASKTSTLPKFGRVN